MTDWTSLHFVVVDVEGNGQQPPDLVELAAVPVVGGVIGEPLSWLVKPDAPIKHFATRIHGLTNKDVAGCPSFEAITGNVLAALDADALVAHNAHVDLGVLSRKLPGWESPEVFDTLKLARRLVPGLDSYRLGNLVEAYSLDEGLPDGLSPHRATYDALVAARLFVLLATKAASLENLRGRPPEEVDEDALF
ncbi:exonuclease domain-containing protein [Streptomyces sp. DT24]|uniref:3'-5' exonuclease n=1 Tax=unclassified Streptomyces TaxID=2593676 RepID=UPI0023B9B71A|nr:3'-5' exonuclease [Streptomyces sp. AM 4-1-1]WEH34025.1 3'-5' exonuclease [Streptomyces sp. AM 4-1-1]